MSIKYTVKEKSLIGNELFEAGAVVELPDGTLPAENLQPMCEKGEAKYQEYLESNAKRVAAMHEAFAGDAGSTTSLAKAIASAVAAAMQAQSTENATQAARILELEAAAKTKKPALA